MTNGQTQSGQVCESLIDAGCHMDIVKIIDKTSCINLYLTSKTLRLLAGYCHVLIQGTGLFDAYMLWWVLRLVQVET